MKRVRSDKALYYFPQEDFPEARCPQMAWSINTFQEKVSEGLIQAVDKQEPTLVHV